MIYSALGYPGSKRRVMDRLLPLFPDNIEDFREPFFGSGSVTLAFLQADKARNCKRITVGDLASEVWAFHMGCKIAPQEVVYTVKKWFNRVVPTYSKWVTALPSDKDYEIIHQQVISEGRNLWREIVEFDTTNASIVERCARTFISNKISFGGAMDSSSLSPNRLCKFRLEQTEQILNVSPLLQNIEILNTSFEETMADVDKDKTFVFLDPPYYAQEGSRLYGNKGDLHKEFPHKKLIDLTKSLECKWLVTYDDSPYIRRMFKGRGIDIMPFQFTYIMSHNADTMALNGEELIIANYKISEEKSYDILKDIL